MEFEYWRNLRICCPATGGRQAFKRKMELSVQTLNYIKKEPAHRKDPSCLKITPTSLFSKLKLEQEESQLFLPSEAKVMSSSLSTFSVTPQRGPPWIRGTEQDHRGSGKQTFFFFFFKYLSFKNHLKTGKGSNVKTRAYQATSKEVSLPVK